MWDQMRIAGRMARAAVVLGRYGPGLASVRAAPASGNGADAARRTREKALRFARALTRLGPSYIKLGQFLATRPDLVGVPTAQGLAELQDRLPPFDETVARRLVEAEFRRPLRELFTEFGAPVAAASIAQVHRAAVAADGGHGAVPRAVKVLRPGVVRNFERDLRGLRWMAGMIEGLSAEGRRLLPGRAVEELRGWVRREMDLRLEGAAAAELAENMREDPEFRVPAVDWRRTSARVLTTEWVDGIPLRDREALRAAGHDPARLARLVLRCFLKQSLRDGFFHADMHPGNLMVDGEGRLVAVDFGIMGRLDHTTRSTYAEILFGMLTRDYMRAANAHFDAGYVPEHHSRADFALAVRAICEPIWGLPAHEMSMGRLLTQLFEVTRQFDMKMRPELLLLQKTMLVAEGVARDLDPDVNVWEVARPILEDWMTEHLSPEARLRDAAETAADLGRIAARMPAALEKMERAAILLNETLDGDGVRLHPETAKAIGGAEARATRASRWALVAALAAAVAALAGIFS
ncbi:MAG: 2-polyprenylphenol 6-hydroxylase [Alphaproteobacteria bacterium]